MTTWIESSNVKQDGTPVTRRIKIPNMSEDIWFTDNAYAEVADDVADILANNISTISKVSEPSSPGSYYGDAGSNTTVEIVVADGAYNNLTVESLDSDTVSTDGLSIGGRVEDPMNYGAEGDGATDDTQALLDAADAAGQYGTVVVHQDHFITSPVDLGGADCVGRGGTIIADGSQSASTWQVGHSENDVAAIYSRGYDDVTVTGLRVNGNDAYATGISLLNGANLTAEGNTVWDCANSGIQLYGNEGSGNDVILGGIIANNHVEHCAWNLVFDGQHQNVTIEGNTSLNATNRHISPDPGEASDTQEIRGMTVTGNVCRGLGTVPSEWDYTESSYGQEIAAICATRGTIFGNVTGNYVFDWPGGVAVNVPPSSMVAVKDNTIHGDPNNTITTGIRVSSHLGPSPISDNEIMQAETGIDINNGDSNKGLFVRNNHMDVVTTGISGPDTLPSPWVVEGNYDENGSVDI